MVEIHCKYDQLIPLDNIVLNPKNRNIHPTSQIDRLSKLLQYWGFRHPLIVSKNSNILLAGHGRFMAAKKLGLKEVPVDYQVFNSPEEEDQWAISDNAISSWAELDFSAINNDIGEWGPEFNLELLGIENFTVDVADKKEENLYTDKIEIPIYEPKGKKPDLSELFDLKKFLSLTSQIDKSSLPREKKEFLKLAASRHIVFNYEKIAEFYAHEEKEAQDLFENSALVIIDFKKAIENGFIKMTMDLASGASNDS